MRYILQEYWEPVTRGNIRSALQLNVNYSGTIIEVDDNEMALIIYYSKEPGQFYPAPEVGRHERWLWTPHDPEVGYITREYDSLEDLVGDNFVDWL